MKNFLKHLSKTTKNRGHCEGVMAGKRGIKEVCCNNTICPPEDEQGTARNMLRIIM